MSTWQPRLGANVEKGGTAFRVWATNARRLDVVLQTSATPRIHALEPEGEGYFAGFVPDTGAGSRYRYRLDGDDARTYPDPCSRFQPEGVHGWSEVIDPRFHWHSGQLRDVTMDGLAIYECHVGRHSPLSNWPHPGGTFNQLRRWVGYLSLLGVTAIELMPVAAFPGRWNWGYDGVDLFAPFAGYGRPDDLRRLVDHAHRRGLAVILDVVYNHLGPDGNYLRAFSDDYFTDRHHTPWGGAINYDGPNSGPVREFVCENACYWLNEFRFDGLRLDATHAIVDDSPRHILAELAERARASVSRHIVIIAEDGRNDVRLIKCQAGGGYGLDAVWADDFHHAVHVFLTGERDGYYADYAGTTAEIATALNEGFVYQGQTSSSTGRPRGTKVMDEQASAFVFSLQNHDQIGNRAFGQRLSTLVSPGQYAVASALLLFAPETPLIFMGQEHATERPFLYFTDHEPELGAKVTAGRRQEFAAFSAFRDEVRRERIPDPQAEETFARSTPDWQQPDLHLDVLRLYRALLKLRRFDLVLRHQDRGHTHAFALDDQALAILRWHNGNYRLLIANFGPARKQELDLPVQRGSWHPILSTTWRRFGGNSTRGLIRPKGAKWHLSIPGEAAISFAWEPPPE